MSLKTAQRTIALMRSGLPLLLLLPLAGLLACGSNATAVAGGGGLGAPTGDYILTISPGTVSAATFVGALTTAGTSVSGVLNYSNPAVCATSALVSFTGTIVNNVLTLTSGPFAGGAVTATIQLPLITDTTGAQNASGTIVIAGGTCAKASSPLNATFVQNFSGTYTGSLSGPNTGAVSLALTEGTANSTGQFPTTGIVNSFVSSNCNLGTPLSASGLVTGTSVQLTAGSTTISATPGGTSSTLNVNINSAALGCPAGTYSGTLTRQ